MQVLILTKIKWKVYWNNASQEDEAHPKELSYNAICFVDDDNSQDNDEVVNETVGIVGNNKIICAICIHKLKRVIFYYYAVKKGKN